jgi:hypothetical protein
MEVSIPEGPIKTALRYNLKASKTGVLAPYKIDFEASALGK